MAASRNDKRSQTDEPESRSYRLDEWRDSPFDQLTRLIARLIAEEHLRGESAKKIAAEPAKKPGTRKKSSQT